ncbi:MAG: cupin domain-containing protein [Acidobacteria bacterium]|nr:cupin domain-containing protein [Acidobacteriota bacterium]
MDPRAWDVIESEPMTDKITRQVTHGRMGTVARFHLARHALVIRHSHPAEQFSHVVQGKLRFRFDDREVIVGAGEILTIPPNVPHAAEAIEDTIVFDFFAPRREDWIKKEDGYLRQKN